MEESYSVKEVLHTFGIARSTLLYYEKQGIIRAQRNPQNGYRTYSHSEVNRLKKCLCIKNIGYSTVEAGELFYDEDAFDEAHLCKYENKLEHEIELQKAMLASIREDHAFLNRDIGSILVTHSTLFYCLRSHCEDGYHRIDQSPEANLLIQHNPLTGFVQFFPSFMEGIIEEKPIARCIRAKDAHLLFDNATIATLPKTGGELCVDVCADTNVPTQALIEKVKQFMEENGLMPNGCAYSFHSVCRYNKVKTQWIVPAREK